MNIYFRENNVQTRGILERDRLGEPVSPHDPEYHKIRKIIAGAAKTVSEMNAAYHDENEVRRLFSQLTGEPADESFVLRPPFYTDFGRNIRVGKNVLVNHGCTFMDRGGITLEDDVVIAPNVNLITTSPLMNPAERRTTVSLPVVIKKNAWIGVGATVMPGVTIGENSVVAAAAVVTRDIPANMVAAGVPARAIKVITETVPEGGEPPWPEHALQHFVQRFKVYGGGLLPP